MAKINNITIYCNEWYYSSINNIDIDNAKNKQLIWSSTNTNVATVHPDTGSIFGVSPGVVTITARTVNGCEQDCFDVTVLKVAVADIIFCEDEIEICEGYYETLTVRWAPGNATNKNINWSSENECVATVDSSGTVFAKKEGTTIIYAQSQDNTDIVSCCRVVVVPAPEFPLWERYHTESDCYKAGTSIGTVKGIVVHSTGADNNELKRYVDAPDLVGTNIYGNHWNQSGIRKMVHAFIGLDKDGNVAIVNTLPYNYACWGVGEGVSGSYNYSPNGHIQFEICEDSLTDPTYFNEAVFGAAVQYCAYLCEQFNLSVDSIVSHKEAHSAGYGSNHGDPDHWLIMFGRTMDDFRNAVRNKLTC